MKSVNYNPIQQRGNSIRMSEYMNYTANITVIIIGIIIPFGKGVG